MLFWYSIFTLQSGFFNSLGKSREFSKIPKKNYSFSSHLPDRMGRLKIYHQVEIYESCGGKKGRCRFSINEVRISFTD